MFRIRLVSKTYGFCLGVFASFAVLFIYRSFYASIDNILLVFFDVEAGKWNPVANVSPHRLKIRSTVAIPSELPHSRVNSSHPDVDIDAFEHVLSQYASPDKWIMLALADMGCLDMTNNFYLTSIKPNNIQNYLIIASDTETCQHLSAKQINCYVYMLDKAAKEASVYQSKDFLRKMNIRTFMILDALNLGYHVLHTDIDVYFMKNPFDEFFCQSHDYDIAPLQDGLKGSWNAGFLFIRATNQSIAVYEQSCHIAKTEPKTDDQKALNRAIGSVKKQGKLRISGLPMNQFQAGKIYWEDAHREFREQKKCSSCVVVHNNWIVSMEAKRYRFREIGMWDDDTSAYYSNPNGKYMLFDNEVSLENAANEGIDALFNAFAIGDILNRSVILPRFHCSKRRCTVLNHLLLRALEKHFPNYRENSFLQHNLVPEQVKISRSPTLVISSEKNVAISERDKRPERAHARIFQPIDSKGADSEEIISWFGNMTESVLQFDNLYGSFTRFIDQVKDKEYRSKVKGVTKSTYRQYK